MGESTGIVFGARPSNGTMGDLMRAQLCDRCTVDHNDGWHGPDNDGGDSCPILLDALAGEHSYPNPEGPPEWGYDHGTGEWVCTKFEGPCPCEGES